MPLNLPDFYTDPSFKRTQDFLEPYGMDILKGDINEYYAPIGSSGGPEFEDMLSMVGRDVKQGVTEDQARRGGRSGAGTYAAAKTIGDVSTKLRWDDYMRSLGGKEFLMGQGKGITEGVATRGLSYGRDMNAFNMDTSRFEYGMQQDEQNRQDREDDAWMDLLSTSIGAVGNIAGLGMFTGGFDDMFGSAAKGTSKVGGGTFESLLEGGGNSGSNFDDLLGDLRF